MIFYQNTSSKIKRHFFLSEKIFSPKETCSNKEVVALLHLFCIVYITRSHYTMLVINNF